MVVVVHKFQAGVLDHLFKREDVETNEQGRSVVSKGDFGDGSDGLFLLDYQWGKCCLVCTSININTIY